MPPSLKKLNMYNAGKFTGGIPSEWRSLTNLKKLDMRECLDGASHGLTRHAVREILDIESVQESVQANRTGELPLELIRINAKGDGGEYTELFEYDLDDIESLESLPYDLDDILFEPLKPLAGASGEIGDSAASKRKIDERQGTLEDIKEQLEQQKEQLEKLAADASGEIGDSA